VFLPDQFGKCLGAPLEGESLAHGKMGSTLTLGNGVARVMPGTHRRWRF